MPYSARSREPRPYPFTRNGTPANGPVGCEAASSHRFISRRTTTALRSALSASAFVPTRHRRVPSASPASLRTSSREAQRVIGDVFPLGCIPPSDHNLGFRPATARHSKCAVFVSSRLSSPVRPPDLIEDAPCNGKVNRLLRGTVKSPTKPRSVTSPHHCTRPINRSSALVPARRASSRYLHQRTE